MGKTVIHLKPYCKGCKELSVVTDKFYADNQVVGSYSGCEHAKKCARIHKHIKEHPYTTYKNMFANCKPLTDIRQFECGLRMEPLTTGQLKNSVHPRDVKVYIHYKNIATKLFWILCATTLVLTVIISVLSARL